MTNLSLCAHTLSTITSHGPLTRYVKLRVVHPPEFRERFPRHRFQRKPLDSDPGMHQGTCVTHMPWCMSGSLTRDGRENVLGIPSACATRKFTYLTRGPCSAYIAINGRNILAYLLFSSMVWWGCRDIGIRSACPNKYPLDSLFHSDLETNGKFI